MAVMHTAPIEWIVRSKRDRHDFIRLHRVVRQLKMELLDGDDGSYLVLELNVEHFKDVKVKCKICSGGPNTLNCCVSCESLPERLHRLRCGHTVCEHCLFADSTYTCLCCKSRTQTKEVTKWAFGCNQGLIDMILRCPYCSCLKAFNDMRLHILEDHYEQLKNMEKQRSEKEKSQECAGTFQDSRSATADGANEERKGTNLGPQECPICKQMWEPQDIEGHAQACLDRFCEMGKRAEPPAASEYEGHLKTWRNDQMENKVNSLSSSIDEEEREKRKCLEEEVKALKETIEALSKRIEALETPLKYIVRDLRDIQNRRAQGTDL